MSPAETFTILPDVLPVDGTTIALELYCTLDDAVQQAVEEPGAWGPAEIRLLDDAWPGTPRVYAATDALALDPTRARSGRTVPADLHHDVEAARQAARHRQAATAGPVTWTVVALWQVTW